MVHYELVKVIINIPGLVEIIINILICYHDLSDFIMSDWGLVFTSKFWFFLCYFFNIKKQPSTIFHLQTDNQTERWNSIMKAYFRAFVSFEQNNWARFLPIIKFTYNNTKNASINHTLFELNCGYHPWISYEEDIDLRFKSSFAKKLSS